MYCDKKWDKWLKGLEILETFSKTDDEILDITY